MAAALIPENDKFIRKINCKFKEGTTIRVTFGKNYLAIWSKIENRKQRALVLHQPELEIYSNQEKRAMDFLGNTER